jgi:hypothetical protein
MAAAILARIGRPFTVAMMLRNRLAVRAEDAIGIEPFDKLIKASRIVWIVALKFHQRIGTVRYA